MDGMDLTAPGRKSMIRDILSSKLPDSEKAEFNAWAENISSTDFLNGLKTYFSDEEVKSAIAEYVQERLTDLEHFCGVRIDAVVSVAGSAFNYRCFNDTMQV